MSYELRDGARLGEVVAAFDGKRALVVGDVMLDEYIWGEVRRISPEAPVPVVETRRRTYRPGGAGNVAANIAALGGASLLCSVAGDDVMAGHLVEALAAERVECCEGLIRVDERPTTVKSRVIAHSQQMLRFDTESSLPIPTAVEDMVLRCCAAQLPEAAVCVLSDYAKGILTGRVCTEIIALARRYNVPVVVDPKGKDYARYADATVITPNTNELGVAVNRLPGEQPNIERDARLLLAELGEAALLVTRGPEGMSLYRHERAPIHISTRARHVYDVTGAGDTVVAALALALAAGAPLELAAMLSNEAAGIAVSKVGTATVTREELVGAIENQHSA